MDCLIAVAVVVDNVPGIVYNDNDELVPTGRDSPVRRHVARM